MFAIGLDPQDADRLKVRSLFMAVIVTEIVENNLFI
jgi:hypothetical protein